VIVSKAVVVADLLPLAETVELGRGALELHPVGVQDIVRLIALYKEPFITMYSAANSPNTDMVQAGFASAITAYPMMVAELIGMSARVEDQHEHLMKIPAGAQLIALEKIWRISVPDPKALKQSLSALTAHLKGLGLVNEKPKVESQKDSQPLKNISQVA
jgi:hypothetical protein